jgi:hypothetical protein
MAVVAAALGMAAVLAAPAASLAASSVSLSVGPDPVVGLPVQYTASATAAAPDDAGYQLWVFVRPANLGPCGATHYDDPAFSTQYLYQSQEMDLQAGQSLSQTWTWEAFYGQGDVGIDTTSAPVGPMLVCGWLEDESQLDASAATASLSFTLSAPHDTMQVSTPNHPRLRSKGTFAVHGTSEAPGHVTLEVLPACFTLRKTRAGLRCAAHPIRGCQATPEAETTYLEEHSDLGIEAVQLLSSEVPPGAFNLKRAVTFGSGWIPGAHTVCAWIGPTGNDRYGTSDPEKDAFLISSAIVSPVP